MLTGADGRTGLRSARGTRGTHRTPGGWRRGLRRGQRGGGGRGGQRSPWRRRLAWTVALAVALAALFALSLSQSLTGPLNSDGASNILQAQAMLHGNPLLRGWWTSDVSFYTTELPEYVLVVALRGLSPDVVHIGGALTYTLTVALAGLLARGRATGGAGLRRAGLAVAIMLAPSILGGTGVFLENPDHFGTSVPVLLLLLVLDWGEGRDEVTAPRWYVPVAACALLAWTQVGDQLSLAAATVPLTAVCAFRLAVTLIRRRPRVELRWDGLLATAALISVEIARIAGRALRSIGGFDQRPIPGTRLASLDQVPGNARILWESIVLLFGANKPATPGRAITISQHIPLAAMADLHVIGLAVAGAGLLAGLAAGCAGRSGWLGRFGRIGWPDQDWADRDRVNQILVVAIGVTIAAGLFGTLMRSLSSAHEVAILLPLGAVLAGRTLPPLARALAQRLDRRLDRAPGEDQARGERVRGERVRGPAVRATTAVTAATVALAGWLAVGVAEMGYAATWPAASVPVQNVAAWLVAHHEYDGLAAYWQATETTVTSGGRVLVAPLNDAGTAPRRWEASSAWYQPSRHRATFVIAEAHPVYPEDALMVATARARFGRPAAEYNVGGHIVMIYHYNLLTRLHDRTFPGPS
jgi:hypothetical protein